MMFRLQQKNGLGNIHSCEEFQALLNQECARTDRNGREFSIMVFYFKHAEKDIPALKHFIHMLTRRVRTTEEIGWLDGKNSIGIILPDTPMEGAEKLAQDVSSLVEKPALPPAYAYKVYSYPSHWIGDMHKNEPASKKSSAPKHNDLPGTGNIRASHNGFDRLLTPHMPLWKRAVDMLGAFAGLVLLSPIFLIIAALIKTVSSGPVFFKQQRVGFLGKEFICWKFRTMKAAADSTLHEIHVCNLYNNDKPLKKLDDNDLRIIPFGRMLRKTGLDELPQLINVLRGEMSLIGPRPDVPYAVCHYLPWQKKRIEAYPGLTGLWQVNGKNLTTFNEMMRLDISYVKQRSFWLDSKILIKTLPAIIHQVYEKSVPQG